MFVELIAATALAASVAAPTTTPLLNAVDHERSPAASRYVPNRWHDSGDPRVWRNVPAQARFVWLCIRRHESLHSGHWHAENPRSSASGAGQWLNGTWDGIKKWVKIDGRFVARHYDEAKDAPPFVQDAAFVHVWKRDGLRMWYGTGCPGTG